jgi:DNA-binding Lrp family transcriptional regulator
MEILKRSSDVREDIGLLTVLDALENEEAMSQRNLSAATGLNLKKINFCLHKLLEKGYIKFERVRRNPQKLVYLYILTPEGLRAKSQLTYNFIKFTMTHYGKIEEKIRLNVDQLIRTDVKRVALYGISDMTRILCDMVSEPEIKIVGLVDEDYHKKDFCGYQILQCDALADLDYDKLLITSLENHEIIDQKLANYNISSEQVWWIQ